MATTSKPFAEWAATLPTHTADGTEKLVALVGGVTKLISGGVPAPPPNDGKYYVLLNGSYVEISYAADEISGIPELPPNDGRYYALVNGGYVDITDKLIDP